MEGKENQLKQLPKDYRLAVPPRRRIDGALNPKQSRPSWGLKNTLQLDNVPREGKIPKSFKKFQKFISCTTDFAEGVFHKLSRNDTKNKKIKSKINEAFNLSSNCF